MLTVPLGRCREKKSQKNILDILGVARSVWILTNFFDNSLFTIFFLFQDQGLDFGLEVLPCSDPPGVKIFGSAPQFHAKNFSHIFVHGQDYEIPGE